VVENGEAAMAKTATQALYARGCGLALWMAAGASWLVGAAASPAVAEPRDEGLQIEQLLKDGWQIAGYTGADDSRSTFILLRHPSEPSLVQCRAGYDVTRDTRIQINCYRLR
jgi:hypothetical protein